MSLYYNENFVNSINQSTINGIINGSIPFNVDAENLSDKQLFVVLQHCLIKYFNENQKPHPNAIKLINAYYKEFRKNPYAFCDSPLISNSAIDYFAPENFRDKVKEFRNSYYDRQAVGNLFNKYLNDNINMTDDEKNRLFAYLTGSINNKDNAKANETIIKYILNHSKDVKSMNTMELKFYCQYIANQAKSNYPIQPEIHIFLDQEKLGGFQSNYYICLNKNSVLTSSIEDITQTVCHEVQHSIQKYASANKINKIAFEYAQMELFRKYLNNATYDTYHKNYRYTSVEIDAEHNGYFNGGVYLDMLGRKDLANKLRDDRKRRLDKRTYYEFMTDEMGKPKTIDRFVVEKMDEIIKAHPEELDRYPVLSVIYRKDGTKKSFESIIAHRATEDVSNRGIVDNYINYGIAHDELSKLNFTEIHQYEQTFKILTTYIRDTSSTLKDYFEDVDVKDNPKQVERMTLYKIHLLSKTLEFVNNNIDKLMQTRENNRISKNSYIYEFIYRIRDFSFDAIQNPVLKNSPAVKDELNELMKKHEYLVSKFNEQYITDRTVDMTSAEKQQQIIGFDGKKISFNDLISQTLPKLDSHMEYKIGDKKLYIGDIIEYYKRNIKSNRIDIRNRIDALKNEVKKVSIAYKEMKAKGNINVDDLGHLIQRLSNLLVGANAFKKENISENEKAIIDQICFIIEDGIEKMNNYKSQYINEINEKYSDDESNERTK